MEHINASDNQTGEQMMNRNMSALFWATWQGDKQTLEQLLQRDASILSNIPDGHQTPLHVSALLGHVSLTKVLLSHGINLAIKKDSSGRTALHLASAEGNLQIVQMLLQFDNELCLSRDEKGRIPLHYAAMRGRTEVVQELIMARPDSLSLVDREESTVFHLCVTYNHLNTLETLVKLDYAAATITTGQPRPPIFARPDSAGNTIIHLAITLKQVEVINYLQSLPEIKEIENLRDKTGFTAHGIVEQSPKDLKAYGTQPTKAGKELLVETDRRPHQPPRTSTDVASAQNDDDYCRTKMFKCVGSFVMNILRWIGSCSRCESY